MTHNIPVNVGILRTKFATFSLIYLSIFSIFCCFLLKTIYWFLLSGLLTRLSIPIGFLYVWGQPTSYYLFHIPLMVVLLSKAIDYNKYEIFLLARCQSKRKYDVGNILAVFFLVFSCYSLMSLTALIVFSFASNNPEAWTQSYLFLKQQGIILVNNSLIDTPVLELIIIQQLLIMLSFVALGDFILLTQTIISNKQFSIIIALCLSCIIYLGSKSDLPHWLDTLMPYRYLFLIYFTDLKHCCLSVIYWILVIAFLCFVLVFLGKNNDFLTKDNETFV